MYGEDPVCMRKVTMRLNLRFVLQPQEERLEHDV